MSYILEALKKAQAERQLGTLPSIHAPLMSGAPDADGGARRHAPWWLALAGGTLLLAVGAAWLWHQQDAAPPGAGPGAPAALAVAAPAPPAAALAQASAQPAQAAALAAQASAPLAPTGGLAAQAVVPTGVPVVPVAALPARAPEAIAAPRSAPITSPAALVSRSAPAPVSAVAAVPAGESKPAVARAAPAPEESAPTLRELPEQIQREVPQLAMGGYIYSKNPADRLLLVDKTLRHEGEELAPGLMLEKLMPKAALLSFKGYRFRVPY